MSAERLTKTTIADDIFHSYPINLLMALTAYNLGFGNSPQSYRIVYNFNLKLTH